MTIRLSIRPATRADLEALARLRRQATPRRSSEPVPPRRQSLRHIDDGCLLAGRVNGRLVARATLDLDSGRLVDLFVAPPSRRRGFGRRMVHAVERLAVQFGMSRLDVDAWLPALPFFTICGYAATAAGRVRTDPAAGREAVHLQRDISKRQTRYGRRVRGLLDEIGIRPDYGRRHRLRLQPECRELASIGTDIHEREQMLHPEAAAAWLDMQRAANAESVCLLVASAYRSVGYQVTLIENKKLRGIAMDDILAVSAAPGYSEHHTGRALDVATPGSRALETEFEDTAAFDWLMTSASEFGFRLSYPRHNRHGIAYEPWHWYFTG